MIFSATLFAYAQREREYAFKVSPETDFPNISLTNSTPSGKKISIEAHLAMIKEHVAQVMKHIARIKKHISKTRKFLSHANNFLSSTMVALPDFVIQAGFISQKNHLSADLREHHFPENHPSEDLREAESWQNVPSEDLREGNSWRNVPPEGHFSTILTPKQ